MNNHIVKKNELLANYLGWEQNKTIGTNFDKWYDSKGLLIPLARAGGELKFHKDWNWLFLVINHLENDKKLVVRVLGTGCSVINLETGDEMGTDCGDKLKSTFETLTDYIQFGFKKQKTFTLPPPEERSMFHNEMFLLHSHAEIEYDRNPSKIVYSEDDVAHLMTFVRDKTIDWVINNAKLKTDNINTLPYKGASAWEIDNQSILKGKTDKKLKI